jgi:hypothetical protein
MSEINARKVPARTRGRADTRASVLIYRSPSRLCETERSASDRDDGFIAEKNRSNPTRRAVIPTKSIGDRWQREGGAGKDAKGGSLDHANNRATSARRSSTRNRCIRAERQEAHVCESLPAVDF